MNCIAYKLTPNRTHSNFKQAQEMVQQFFGDCLVTRKTIEPIINIISVND